MIGPWGTTLLSPATPASSPLGLEAGEVRLLTEIGFLAAGRGDIARASAIFSALALVRPGRAFAHVGLAMAYLNTNQATEAVRVLAQAKTDKPEEQQTLDVWRGVALQLAGHRDESIRLLRHVVACEQHLSASPASTSDCYKLAKKLLGDSDGVGHDGGMASTASFPPTA